jgi:hypothetical protein
MLFPEGPYYIVLRITYKLGLISNSFFFFFFFILSNVHGSCLLDHLDSSLSVFFLCALCLTKF